MRHEQNGHLIRPSRRQECAAKDATRAYVEKFSGCKVPIELVRIEGGGHTIPGSWSGGERGRMVGPYANDFDSAALIWELFHKARG